MIKQSQVCIFLTSSTPNKQKKFSHLHNWPLAVATTRREELVIVLIAVRPSISLKEACGAQLYFTRHTHKVFRVPHLTQCCDHLETRKKI